MKREAVHALWAPDGDTWRPWVKPVLFAALPPEVGLALPRARPEGAEDLAREARELFSVLEGGRPVTYRGRPAADAAVVLDLAGDASVELGVALAEHGFRPVPLFNAVPTPPDVNGMVELRHIMRALADRAPALRDVAPFGAPCFLLDADRMARGRGVTAGVFDNRSQCRLADFPSAESLHAAGIRRFVVVCSGPLQTDLATVLSSWQSAGLAGHRFLHGRLRAITVRGPSLLRRLVHVLRYAGLHERPDGSFGAIVPHGG